MKMQKNVRNAKASCTFCGEGRGALLDSVKLQQQAVQLRQVASQQWVHGDGRRIATLLFIGETGQSLNKTHQCFTATTGLYGNTCHLDSSLAHRWVKSSKYIYKFYFTHQQSRLGVYTFNEISIFGRVEAEMCLLFMTCIRGPLHRWVERDCCSLWTRDFSELSWMTEEAEDGK